MAIHGHHWCPQTVCTNMSGKDVGSKNLRILGKESWERWREAACTNSLQLPGRHSRRLNQNTKAMPKAPKCGTGGTRSLPHGCCKIFKTGFNLSPQRDTVFISRKHLSGKFFSRTQLILPKATLPRTLRENHTDKIFLKLLFCSHEPDDALGPEEGRSNSAA